jgi:hypothetical protein
MDLSKITNIVFDGIDYNDYPDFCDAFVASADYGFRCMTQKEVDELNENHRDFVYEQLMDYLY